MNACENCISGKLAKKPFDKKWKNRAEEVLGLVHGDICELIKTLTLSGNGYILTFIDDFNSYIRQKQKWSFGEVQAVQQYNKDKD